MTGGSTHGRAVAVIVGSGINALGVLRSLAARSVRCWVLGPPSGPAFHSRHGTKIPCADTGGPGLLLVLASLASKSSRPRVIFLTEEMSVRTLSAARDQLSSDDHLTFPSPPIVEALLDKTRFQTLAKGYGFAIPRAATLSSETDLRDLASLRFPCVLKPAYRHDGYGARFQKAYVVASPDEAATLYRQIAPVLADMIVQEWIDGLDDQIHFTLQYIGRDGRLVATFTGRKLRSWPPRIGGTASCTSAPKAATELDDETYRFFRKVGFVGLGGMEYKRDRRDGRFYMIEPTVCRTDFQEEVATLNGCNIPYAAFCDAVGLPFPEPSRAQTPSVVWRESRIDRWAKESGGEVRGREAMPARVVDALFRWSDPGPALHDWVNRLRARIVL